MHIAEIPKVTILLSIQGFKSLSTDNTKQLIYPMYFVISPSFSYSTPKQKKNTQKVLYYFTPSLKH